METVDRLFGPRESRRVENHAVPRVHIFAPILPVLDDIVQRDAPFAVFGHDPGQFVERPVALFRHPEPECRFGLHGHLSGQAAHSRHRIVHVAAVDEIVVRTVADFRVERGDASFFRKGRFGVVVPIEGVTAGREQYGTGDFAVGLYEVYGTSPVVERAVLVLPQSVYGFVGGQGETLDDAVPAVRPSGDDSPRMFRQYRVACRSVPEEDPFRYPVVFHGEPGGPDDDFIPAPFDPEAVEREIAVVHHERFPHVGRRFRAGFDMDDTRVEAGDRQPCSVFFDDDAPAVFSCRCVLAVNRCRRQEAEPAEQCECGFHINLVFSASCIFPQAKKAIFR